MEMSAEGNQLMALHSYGEWRLCDMENTRKGGKVRIKDTEGGPWQSSGKDSALLLQGAWILSMVGELRSHILSDLAEKEKKMQRGTELPGPHGTKYCCFFALHMSTFLSKEAEFYLFYHGWLKSIESFGSIVSSYHLK